MTRRDELLKLAGEFLVVSLSASEIYNHSSTWHGDLRASDLADLAKQRAYECAEMADKLEINK